MNVERRREKKGGRSQAQYSAIKFGIRIGRLLVNDHPEIEGLYRAGKFQAEIAEIIDVKGEYNVPSDVIAKNSVFMAINGHNGSYGIEPYDGLIQDLDDLARLEYEHRAESGRKNAELALGMFGINPETGDTYVEETRRKTAELGTGIYGYNQETRVKHSVEGGRIGGRLTTLARGQTPWSDEETEDAYSMALQPQYQH